jgi:hypothetical protein
VQQRVEALTTYRTQLQQLEVRQAELDRLTRIESAADELTDLVAGTAHDEQAIANLGVCQPRRPPLPKPYTRR